MDHFSPDDDTPLYIQVADELRHKILNGEFAANDPLPSEAEMINALDVSRVTVRQAISLLSEEGLLERIQGKGSFVKALAVEQNFLGLREYRRDLRRQGHEPSFEILSYERCKPNASIRAMFGLDLAGEVHSIERLKRSDGKPIMLERLYVPCHLLPTLDQLELRTQWFGDILVSSGLNFRHARKSVQPIVVGNVEAKILAVRPNSIGLLVDRTTWGSGSTPIVLTRSIISGDAAKFFIDVKVEQTDYH
ncbi:GntR family transcriptional regulator [Ensifer adhaerens]|uniref:GntR family transcriptional regulator n=1 Tax=Ensifer adhaerens TaxID=106592 RepID=A0A9Q8YGR9_ENSAD|nr:GntR family transcriptional regulator [Ensifer adhaerens]USJ28413.1 GntR family transcriptional regulator [Ensifer adhaerens]